MAAVAVRVVVRNLVELPVVQAAVAMVVMQTAVELRVAVQIRAAVAVVVAREQAQAVPLAGPES